VWRISLRDLVWRRRRLGVAVIGTALVMAMALLSSGIGAAFTAEAQRSVHALGGTFWWVPSSAPGAFNTPPVAPDADAGKAAALPGVTGADPVVILSQSLEQHSSRIFVVVYGYHRGGMTRLALQHGRLPANPLEAVADEKLAQSIGSQITLGKGRFTIVGTTSGMTSGGGIPDIFVDIRDLDTAQFQGEQVANAIIVAGHPSHPLAGYRALGIDAVVTDALLPITQAIGVVTILTYLFWVVAAVIVGAFIYLSTNERRRDFAVLKAIGVGSRSLASGVIVQSTAVALGAALVSVGIAFALSPIFPIEVSIPATEFIILPFGALIIGLLASLIALRRVLSLDPALAFAGAA
jgi:putative ABC transport system permease protein